MVFRPPRVRPSMTIQKEVHGEHLVDAASVPLKWINIGEFSIYLSENELHIWSTYI